MPLAICHTLHLLRWERGRKKKGGGTLDIVVAAERAGRALRLARGPGCAIAPNVCPPQTPQQPYQDIDGMQVESVCCNNFSDYESNKYDYI